MNEAADPPPATGGTTGLTQRVHQLETQMAALIEAVEVLARGLEGTPMAEPDRRAEEAARRAHELLLLAKPSPPGGGPGKDSTST